MDLLITSEKSEKSKTTSTSTQQSMATVIEVKNVTKYFKKNVPVVSNLNFEVQSSQIFCLLGPSGSGKSTTVRMLTGVYQPSEGFLRVLGFEPHRFTAKTKARIGYMPQQFVLFPELTTLENLNLVASAYALSFFGRAKRVREALEFVNLWDARNRPASQLSGGMRRRLELATTLIHQPELIFVDEPTAGIDPVLRAKFWEHFKNLRDQNRTLFVTTQYVTEADYCDKVAILNRGRLLALGTPEELRLLAMNGEIVNLTLLEITSRALQLLQALPMLRSIQTISTQSLRLTVENASDALQAIVTTFQQNDLLIQSIEPYRPDFEEVFVRLLEQDHSSSENEAESEIEVANKISLSKLGQIETSPAFGEKDPGKPIITTHEKTDRNSLTTGDD